MSRDEITKSEMKNTGLNTAEDKMRPLEDGAVDTTRNEREREKMEKPTRASGSNGIPGSGSTCWKT